MALPRPVTIIRRWFAMALLAGSLTAAFAAQREVTATTLVPRESSPPPAEGEDVQPEPWRYLLHLPKGYEDSDKKWPLMFYLHGRSARGNDFSRVRRYGPPSFLDKKPGFPFIAVSPQLPAGSWPYRSLLELIDELTELYRIDENRIYLTGVSLGGGGAWYLAATNPDRFAAMVPLCGYGGVSLAKKLTNLPIWAFHGAEDAITPLEPHQKLVDAVNQQGGNATMTVIPGGNHGNIIVPVYKKQELYDWLLKQERGKPIVPVKQSKPAQTVKVASPKPRPALIAKPIAGNRDLETYEIQAGDTLWKLAREFDTTIDTLKSINKMTGDTIYVGQTLRYPALVESSSEPDQ